jgi:hypothetical protein
VTATEPAVREAASRAWSLIADHRAGRLPDEPGMPLGIALEIVTDTGCEREVALQALCDEACRLLRARRPLVQDRESCASVEPLVELMREPIFLLSAVWYCDQVRVQQLARRVRDHEAWVNRADWLAWADDARRAILWLRALAAECAK